MTSGAASSQHQRNDRIKVMIAQTASADEFDAAVIANILHSSLRNRVQLSRFQAAEDGSSGESWLGGIRRFRRTVRENEPDIIHLYFGGNFLKAAPYIFAARGLGAKLICHQTRSTDDAMQSAGFLARTFMRAALKRCSAVVVPAEFIKEELETVLPAERITVIRDAARLVDFRRLPKQNKARSTLNLRTDKIVVLTVTDQQSKAAANDILAAAALVKRMDDSVQFVIAGPTDAAADDTADNVKLIPGEVDGPTLGLLLGAADIYLLPACTDASPAAVIDAMGASLPVIAPNVGVIPEIVENEGTGLLLEPGKLGELPDAIERLSKDRNLRRKMQTAAFVRFRRMFDVERAMVPGLHALYKTLVPARKDAPPVERGDDTISEGGDTPASDRRHEPADASRRAAGTSEQDTEGASTDRRRNSRRRSRRPQQDRQTAAATQTRDERKPAEPLQQREERPNSDRQASSDQRERSDRKPQRTRRPQRSRRQNDESDVVMPEKIETDDTDRSQRPSAEDTERNTEDVQVVFNNIGQPRPPEENDTEPEDKKTPEKEAPAETPDEARKRLEEAAERWEERL